LYTTPTNQCPSPTSYVERGCWYRTQDLGVAGDYYGLVDTNLIKKPSFAAYQHYATD
jgi:hypothetical protein